MDCCVLVTPKLAPNEMTFPLWICAPYCKSMAFVFLALAEQATELGEIDAIVQLVMKSGVRLEMHHSRRLLFCQDEHVAPLRGEAICLF